MENNAFEDVLTDYFFSKALRPATEWSYRKVVKSFIRFTGNNIKPDDVDKKMVLTWRRHVITDNGLSKRTWNNKVAHMRAIFNHAISQGHFAYRENPFNGAIARPDVKRKKTLTDVQIKKIYLLMEQRDADECSGRLENQRNALRPAWCVFRSIRSAIRICSINREPNFFYCFLTRFFVAFHYRVIFPH